MKGVAPLIRDVCFGALMADISFDANWPPKELEGRRASAVIAPKSNRKQQRDCDTEACKWRHLVENPFANLLIAASSDCQEVDQGMQRHSNTL